MGAEEGGGRGGGGAEGGEEEGGAGEEVAELSLLTLSDKTRCRCEQRENAEKHGSVTYKHKHVNSAAFIVVRF